MSFICNGCGNLKKDVEKVVFRKHRVLCFTCHQKLMGRDKIIANKEENKDNNESNRR